MKKQGTWKKRGIIRQILKDHFHGFMEMHSHHLPEALHACKSRFCHGCGKKYTDEWAEKQQERILNVPHRHMVFTVPQELRNVFFQNRRKLNELSNQVAKVITDGKIRARNTKSV